MVRYDGVYHVFWWGHAVSTDLVHWEELPYPMVGADGSFDYFSGSVVVDEQNTAGFAQGDEVPMIAIYTMHNRATDEEAQGLSVSRDSTTFEYYEGNPVLDAGTGAFRDPQVWWDEQNQRWLMIIALPNQRRVSFYTSPDMKAWEYLSDFGGVGALEGSWEVPDLIQLPVEGDASDQRWVLMCGMGPNRVQYFIGDWDGTQFTLDPAANGTDPHWLDYGPDYYAARTYRDYDEVEDRTVLMAWMGNWEYANWVPTYWGKGILALPRELELRSTPDGLQIFQHPISEFESLRGDSAQIDSLDLDGVRPLTEFTPARNTYEIEASFAVTDPQAKFGLRLAINGRYGISVGYDASTSELFIDRTHPENGSVIPDFAKYVTAPLQALDGMIRLHIYVDQSSVEVFANDGEVTLSAVMFPNADNTGIELFAEGGSARLTDFQAWELGSIWN
jgi:fructan beta-fructosidase